MTQFLLDTNILLWYFWGSDRVVSIRELIESERTQIFVSVVSLWEIVIKVRAGKLDVNLDEMRFFAKENEFYELPVTDEYINAYLELSKFHHDPFDHMLLAQTITSPMRLITGDSQLADYSSLVMVI